MKIKNNSKNLTSVKQKNINYSINEFFSLDMFNPITQSSYFDKYDPVSYTHLTLPTKA